MNNNNQYAHYDILNKKKIADDGLKFRFLVTTIMATTIAGAALSGYLLTPPDYLQATAKYALANVLDKALAGTRANPKINIQWGKKTLRGNARYWAQNKMLQKISAFSTKRLALGGGIGFALGIGGLVASANYRRKKEQELLADRIISGTKIVTESALAKLTFEKENPNQFAIGSVPVPTDAINRHFCIVGSTGTGKSTILENFLQEVSKAGDLAIIYDASSELVSKYFDENLDVLLNPYDARSPYYSLFDELEFTGDADRLAKFLVPATNDRDKDIWLTSCRLLVGNILRELKKEGKTSIKELLEALQFKSKKELEVWLSKTSSARIFAEDAERATGSVLFMLGQACNLLMLMRAEPIEGKEDFSFRKLFSEENLNNRPLPFVFIPKIEAYFEAVRPILSLYIDSAASATLNLSPNRNRKIYFFLDEVADLQKLDSLPLLLSEGRKYGASVFISFQSIGLFRNTYGKDLTDGMVGCLNTRVFLGLTDAESRSWASDTIGKVEVEISTLSETIDPKTGKFNKTLSTSRQIRAAVLESELRLERHQAYLLFPDGLPCAKIKLTNAHIQARGGARHERFIPIDISQTLWGQMNSEKPQDSIISLSGGPV